MFNGDKLFDIVKEVKLNIKYIFQGEAIINNSDFGIKKVFGSTKVVPCFIGNVVAKLASPNHHGILCMTRHTEPCL
jgi:hypothetical protein